MVGSEQYTPTTKYIVKATFQVGGVVEKPDVIGAIFGQTEGLFGPDLDLRELQKGGRIGRIEIQLETKLNKTNGMIAIPSSLDKVSTAIIAAAIESVDRIGPCDSKIVVERVEDVREEKRKSIMEKAKEILRKWITEATPSTEEVVREVSESIRAAEVIDFGPERLPAGPDVLESGSIIVVEGRADVISLLRCGIKNAIGLEGMKVPETIVGLCKNKEVTAFLDGDRAGDLILKELMQMAELDYVARAPPGKEVEDLTPKEIMKSLRDKVPADQAKIEKVSAPKTTLPENVLAVARGLRGTLEAIVFDGSGNQLARMPVSELAESIGKIEGAHTLIFDGIVTQRLLDVIEGKSIKLVVGDRVSDLAKRPADTGILTLSDIL